MIKYAAYELPTEAMPLRYQFIPKLLLFLTIYGHTMNKLFS